MGFFKKNTGSGFGSGSGFIKKTRDLARLKTRHLNLQKHPLYIYIYIYSNPNPVIPHFFTLQQPTFTLPQSELLTSVRQSLISAQSDTPSPSTHAVSQSNTPSRPHSLSHASLASSPSLRIKKETPSTANASFRRIGNHPTCKFYFFFLFLFVSKFWI